MSVRSGVSGGLRHGSSLVRESRRRGETASATFSRTRRNLLLLRFAFTTYRPVSPHPSPTLPVALFFCIPLYQGTPPLSDEAAAARDELRSAIFCIGVHAQQFVPDMVTSLIPQPRSKHDGRERGSEAQ